jgi:hypothetical protein
MSYPIVMATFWQYTYVLVGMYHDCGMRQKYFCLLQLVEPWTGMRFRPSPNPKSPRSGAWTPGRLLVTRRTRGLGAFRAPFFSRKHEDTLDWNRYIDST